MKFIRFRHLQKIHFGLLIDNQIQVWTHAPWDGGSVSDILISYNDVKLISPCNPGKVIAIAINYPGATGLIKDTEEPLVFIKPSSSVIGPDQIITSPFKGTPVWGECELGIVIGRRLSKATTKEASEGIFGYTIGNDVSCENVNGWDHHLARSKGADTFCVLGPWIDTEYNPNGKWIRGYHNKTLIRDGYCQERLWSEPELLVWLSSWITLEPGDVVITGTPSRVQDRIYFKEGDRFTCVIEELGELSNPFKFAK